MAPKLRFQRPEILHEGFGKRNVIVLGAPAIGKTEIFDEREERGFCTVERELAASVEVPDDESVVVDDFCRAYLSAGEDPRDLLSELLDREQSVCLVTRPRSLDWLFESDDVDLTADVLSEIKDVYCLRYDPGDNSDPRDDGHLEDAAKRCREIWQEEGYDDIPEVSTFENALSSEPSPFRVSEYEFDDDRLGDLFAEGHDRKYPATLVPPLVVELGGALPGRTVSRDALGEFLRDLSFAGFYDASKQTLGDLLDPGTLLDVGSSAAVLGDPFVAGATLVLWRQFGSDEADDLLSVLDETAVLSTTEEQIEIELGLPPYAFDQFRELSSGDTPSRLVELAESAPDRLDAFEERADEFENGLSDLRNRIEDLEASVEEFENVSDFLDRHTRKATSDLDDLGSWLADEERTLLHPLVDEVSPDDVVLYAAGEDDEEADGLLVDRVVDALDESPFVVLKGPHGTGKTTAAYKAGRRLEPEYDVRIPNFGSPEFVEEALRQETTGDVLLYASYQRGHPEAQVEQADLRHLFRWVREGVVVGVLFECRDELWGSLRLLDQTDDEIWSGRELVQFEPLPDEEHVEKLVKWVADVTGSDVNVDEVVSPVLDISRGPRRQPSPARDDSEDQATPENDWEDRANPEIAKLATRFALSPEHSLDDIATADDLVWADIRTILGGADAVRESQREIFRFLAVATRFTAPELRDLANLAPETLRICRRTLQYYLGRAVRNDLANGKSIYSDTDWRITPDIYADVAFRYFLLHGPGEWDDDGLDVAEAPEVSIYDSTYRDVFESGIGDFDDRYPEVASNLATAYAAADRINGDILLLQCVDRANDLFSDLCHEGRTLELLEISLVELLLGGVPLAPDTVNENIDRIFDSIVLHAERLNIEPSVVAQNLVGRLIGNHLSLGDRLSVRDIYETTAEFARRIENQFGNDPAEFLENIYAIAFLILTIRCDSPEEVDEWNEHFVTLVDTAATEGPHEDEGALFLENAYALALRHLTEQHGSPEEVDEWIEHFVTLVDTAATEGPHEDEAPEFLSSVYAVALWGLADRYESPEEVDEWIEYFVGLADTVATEGTYDVLAAEFLGNVYKIALSNLVETYDSPEEGEEWIEYFLTLADTAATEGAHDVSAAQFLANVYAMTMTSLADRYDSPEEVEEWIEYFVALADTAATEGPHEDEATSFLENVYGMALLGFANRFDSPEEGEAWIEYFVALADTAATEGPHEEEVAWFLENVYALTLLNLADTHDSLEEVEAWAKYFLALADTAATEGPHEEEAAPFLENVYALALSEFANRYDSAEEGEEWIEYFLTLADTAATEGAHDVSAAQFLANVYAMALIRLVVRYDSPEEGEEWIEYFLTLADTAATEGAHDVSAAQFLANVYAVVLLNLTGIYDSPEGGEMWVEYFLALADTAATEGPHEDEAPEFLSSVYAVALWGLADRYESPEKVDEWIKRFVALADTVATESTHHIPVTEFLTAVYGRTLEKLADRYGSPEEVEEWIEYFVALANTAAAEGAHDVSAEQFLTSVYAIALLNLTGIYDSPEEGEEWIEHFVALADTATTEGVHHILAVEFLENIYAIALIRIIDRYDSPEEVEGKIEYFVTLVDTAATESTHDIPAAEFLENVYATALIRLVDRYDSPEEVEEWIEYFVTLVDTAATESPHDAPAAEFLASVYGMALEKLADQHDSPEEVEEWIEYFVGLADTAATEGPHEDEATEFLSSVYALALGNLSNRYNSSEGVDKWIEHFVALAGTTAENGPYVNSPPTFLAQTLMTILVVRLYQVARGRSLETAPEWHEFLLACVVTELDADELVEFYTAYFELIRTTGIIPWQWISWLVADTVGRCFDAGPKICTTDSQHVGLVARLVADVVHDGYQQRGASVFETDYFASNLSPLLTLDAPQFADVVSETVRILHAGDTSEWIYEGEEASNTNPTDLDAASDAFCVVAVGRKLARDGPDDSLHALVDDLAAAAQRDGFAGDVYVRAAREVVASTPPDEESARVTEFLDRALSTVDPHTDVVNQYLSFVRDVAADDDRDPAWLPWLVGDALARTVRITDSPFGDRDAQVDVVARVAALAVHHRRKRLDTFDVAGDTYFERIVEGVRTVESDDRQFFERVVSETATLLDEEYFSGTAVLDWQDAFDVT
jgi:hypothetical protein